MVTLESVRVTPASVMRNVATTNTYKAVEVTSPGVFNLVERTIIALGPGQVRIRVEACGVCHSDAATMLNQFPGLTYPRVPGHEVVGVIEELGPGILTWKVEQRVGVDFSEVRMANVSRVFAVTSSTVFARSFPESPPMADMPR